MRITMYLFHNVLERRELNMKRCDKCNRPLFKYSADEMIVANNGPSKYDVYEPGSKYIEIRCHSCGSDYKILFQ